MKTTIKQTWANEKNFGTNSLAYFVSRTGQHVVTHYMNAGETANDMPEVYRHTTVEAARQTWAKLVKTLAARGYTKRIK